MRIEFKGAREFNALYLYRPAYRLCDKIFTSDLERQHFTTVVSGGYGGGKCIDILFSAGKLDGRFPLPLSWRWECPYQGYRGAFIMSFVKETVSCLSQR